MKVSYKGIKQDLPAKLQEKLDAKFAKLSRLVDGRGEKQAHVVVTSERHLHKAEITLRVHNHQLVGIGSNSDVFAAMSSALERIEKQAMKEGAKWREITRRSEPMKAASAKAVAPIAVGRIAAGKAAAGKGRSGKSGLGKGAVGKTASGKRGQAQDGAVGPGARVFRADRHERRKPITLEEALLEMEDGRDYVAYRDADTQVVCMLIRRRDGHYDLIET